jgi:hypothetical protein
MQFERRHNRMRCRQRRLGEFRGAPVRHRQGGANPYPGFRQSIGDRDVGTACSGELAHFPYADPEGCAQTIADNRDFAIVVKLRYGPGIVWEYTAEPVKAARRAADMAGVPMMVHITDSPLPCRMTPLRQNRSFGGHGAEFPDWTPTGGLI